jgi:hypothetical protein
MKKCFTDLTQKTLRHQHVGVYKCLIRGELECGSMSLILCGVYTQKQVSSTSFGKIEKVQ